MNFGNDSYGYKQLEEDVFMMKHCFGIPCFSIGRSVLGRELYCIKIGRGKRNVFYNGAHHALEWLTSPLLVRFAYDVQSYAQSNRRLEGYNAAELLERVTLHILPMVNPDGAELVLNPGGIPADIYKNLTLYNRGGDFAAKWQANINGVDLNHNYDAAFHLSRAYEYENNITGPSPTRYAGEYPESEPEVRAVCDYVRQNSFDLCMAFHSQGEVIYYDFNGHVPPNGYEIARLLGRESGYLPDRAEGIASFGGFKDWFIDKFDRPAYTVEIGLGKNPLGFYKLEGIYRKILGMMIMAAYLA